MGNKMTWEDMKKNYPDEWLLIVDFEPDSSGHISRNCGTAFKRKG